MSFNQEPVRSDTGAMILESRVKYDPPSEGTTIARLLLESFRLNADKVLLEDGTSWRNYASQKSQWTGADVLAEAGKLATGLTVQTRLKPGQVVHLCAEHTVESVLVALGIVLAGGALSALLPEEGYESHLKLCKLTRPSVLVFAERRRQMAEELRKAANIEAEIVLYVDSMDTDRLDRDCFAKERQRKIDTLKKIHHAQDVQMLFVDSLEEIASSGIDPKQHVANYTCTSGSTGVPKVVANTHEELVHVMSSLISATRNDVQGMPEGSRLLPLSRDSVLTSEFPFGYVGSLQTIYLSLCLGSKLVVVPCREVNDYWRIVKDCHVTAAICGTGVTFKRITRLMQARASGEVSVADLSRLSWLACFGHKVAFGEQIGEINAHFENLAISQFYGSAEMGFVSMLPLAESKTHLDSIGYLMPGYKAKLADPACGQPIKRLGYKGELLLWTRGKFKRYVCHATGTSADNLNTTCYDEQGFYRTGDQVYFDTCGHLFVDDFYNDSLYLAGGETILPCEIETIMFKHPLVGHPAVVGVPDPKSSGFNVARAFVKLIPKQSAGFQKLQSGNHPLVERYLAGDNKFIESNICEFVAEQVSCRNKQLLGGAVVLEDFPRTGLLEKIDKKALRLIVVE